MTDWSESDGDETIHEFHIKASSTLTLQQVCDSTLSSLAATAANARWVSRSPVHPIAKIYDSAVRADTIRRSPFCSVCNPIDSRSRPRLQFGGVRVGGSGEAPALHGVVVALPLADAGHAPRGHPRGELLPGLVHEHEAGESSGRYPHQLPRNGAAAGFRVQGLGFKVTGFRVHGLRFWI